MLEITIDGKKLQINQGYTIIQACEIAGIEIPRFCYHERLKIAGNCRMCLVEVEKSPKLVASCAMPLVDGMIIYTNTPKVATARKGVMEFLLINHPLDCPICDQGGECDLQDQAFKYGNNIGQFQEHKRSVVDKNMGPLVQTHMTRCIQCTRCIRFATDIAGIEEIGTIGRGQDMEISTYLNKAITSELSGNLVDICPVGALTSKPYEFRYRSWELQKTRSIDVFDAIGSNIRIDSKGLEVIRVLPEICEEINQEWLSDKARFSCDGLKYQRLDRPYARIAGKLEEISWQKALEILQFKITNSTPQELAAICGSIVDCESIFAFKALLQQIDCYNIASNQFGYGFDTTSRANYLFNTTISGIDDADFCLLIGADPRYKAPVLNARIGINVRERGLIVARIGQANDQTYCITELGESVKVLEEILLGQNQISHALSQSKRPMMIIGDGVYARGDWRMIQNIAHQICSKYNFIQDNWNGFNILHNDAGSVGMLDLGLANCKGSYDLRQILDGTKNNKIKFVYLFCADEFDMHDLGSAFVVYQGHHGDNGASRADLILPGCAYTEKDGIYVNLEGRPQYSRSVVKPPGMAKDDKQIFIDIAKQLNLNLPFSHYSQVRDQMVEEFKIFKHMGRIMQSPVTFTNNQVYGNTGHDLANLQLTAITNNYYLNNPISRSSKTMLDCAKFINQVKVI